MGRQKAQTLGKRRHDEENEDFQMHARWKDVECAGTPACHRATGLALLRGSHVLGKVCMTA